jgi:hypothetical protein
VEMVEVKGLEPTTTTTWCITYSFTSIQHCVYSLEIRVSYSNLVEQTVRPLSVRSSFAMYRAGYGIHWL